MFVDENSLKITFLGETGIGKTSIINRICQSTFKENEASTVVGGCSQKEIIIGKRKISCELWDTAGQEKYLSVGRLLFKDAYIICLVYDITRKDTFIAVKEKWLEEVKENGEKFQILGIVGNKSDMYEHEEVSEEEARQFANEVDATFMLVSAKNGNNCDLLLNTLVTKFLKVGPNKLDEVFFFEDDQIRNKRVSYQISSDSIIDGKKKKKCCK